MKKLKRVFGSVANLASGRGSDHGSGSGSHSGGAGGGALSTSSRSMSGSLHDESPRRGSYISFETRSLDSFTSGHSSATSPRHTDAANDKNFTKLHKWAAVGDTVKLKKFIKKVEVDARDSEGRTPLHYAAGSGRGDAVLFLLGSKADAEARDNSGATPLFRAVERGQIHVTQMLLQRRVDVKTADDRGQTCIHLAARSGAIELLSLLLDCGGDPDGATKLGRTPLHSSCAENQEETAETLLRHGADVNARDREGVTPLMLAAKVGGVGLVENLVDHGANLNSVDSSHWSAADYARFTNHNQLHHRLTTLAQNRAGSSLVPQGLLNVSDESGERSEREAAPGERKEGSGDDNSWKDDSDVSSVREKPKISLAKFLPSSDDSENHESGDNIAERPTSTTGPPKPPRLYTSQSSLGSELGDTAGEGATTAAASDPQSPLKDDDSWKSSSEEEKPKPNLKALGLLRTLDSDQDEEKPSENFGKSSKVGKDMENFGRSSENFGKSSKAGKDVENLGDDIYRTLNSDEEREIRSSEKFGVKSGSRVGKEDFLAELGLGDVQYHSSEEDISFDEDDRMLPIEGSEGTPTKIVGKGVDAEEQGDTRSRLEDSPVSSRRSKEFSHTSPRKSFDSPRHSFESPRQSSKTPRKSFESPRHSFDSTRRSSESPRKSFESPRQSYDSPRPSKSPRKSSKTPRKSYDSPRQSFESSRQSFESPRHSSKTPRHSESPRISYDSPRQSFESPRKSYDSPRHSFESSRDSEISNKRKSSAESSKCSDRLRNRRSSIFSPSKSPIKSPIKSPYKKSMLQKLSAFDNDSNSDSDNVEKLAIRRDSEEVEIDKWDSDSDFDVKESEENKEGKCEGKYEKNAKNEGKYKENKYGSSRSEENEGKSKENKGKSEENARKYEKNEGRSVKSEGKSEEKEGKSEVKSEKNKNEGKSDESEGKYEESEGKSDENEEYKRPLRGTLSKEGTLGRQGTLQESEEIWESNAMKLKQRNSSSSSLSIESKVKGGTNSPINARIGEGRSRKIPRDNSDSLSIESKVKGGINSPINAGNIARTTEIDKNARIDTGSAKTGDDKNSPLRDNSDGFSIESKGKGGINSHINAGNIARTTEIDKNARIDTGRTREIDRNRDKNSPRDISERVRDSEKDKFKRTSLNEDAKEKVKNNEGDEEKMKDNEGGKEKMKNNEGDEEKMKDNEKDEYRKVLNEDDDTELDLSDEEFPSSDIEDLLAPKNNEMNKEMNNEMNRDIVQPSQLYSRNYMPTQMPGPSQSKSHTEREMPIPSQSKGHIEREMAEKPSHFIHNERENVQPSHSKDYIEREMPIPSPPSQSKVHIEREIPENPSHFKHERENVQPSHSKDYIEREKSAPSHSPLHTERENVQPSHSKDYIEREVSVKPSQSSQSKPHIEREKSAPSHSPLHTERENAQPSHFKPSPVNLESPKYIPASTRDKISPPRQKILGAVSFSDEESESQLDSSINFDDEDMTETESAHINPEMKDALLVPLSSLPDAWNVGNLRGLVRELRLRLEKEVGQRGALEMEVARLHQQEQQTRVIFTQHQQALHHHQLEVGRLSNIIRQLEYQIQCQEDKVEHQNQCVADWQDRYQQMEKECHSLQSQTLQQDQMVESLMLQLRTKETMNNTLQSRLHETAGQTKYVSMKSCQTDESLTRISCQSSHSQTDIIGLARLMESIEGEDIDRKTKDLSKTTPDSQTSPSPTQAKSHEKSENQESVAVHIGTQYEQDLTDVGIQYAPETSLKSSQTELDSLKAVETRINSSQTDQVSDMDDKLKEPHRKIDKTVESSCQAVLSSRDAFTQTDSQIHTDKIENNTDKQGNTVKTAKNIDKQGITDTKINMDTDKTENNTDKQGNMDTKLNTDTAQVNLRAEVENMLRNFSDDIKLYITEASQNSQTSALDGVSKNIERHLNRLNDNIGAALEQVGAREASEDTVELKENIRKIQDTLKYQREIMIGISADATEIKGKNLEGVIEGVDSGIQKRLEGFGRELGSIQDTNENNRELVRSIETSLKDLRENNERLLKVVSDQRTICAPEELRDLKQHLDEHLKAVRSLVKGEDSGVSSKGMLERLDTIEKSLSVSIKNCTTEDMSDLQLGVRQLSEDLDRKILGLEEGLSKTERPEFEALELQLRGLRESTEGIMRFLKSGESENTTILSEALEENFQIVHEQVRRLQQTLLTKINEVAEHVNLAEDQQGSRLARQVAEVAQQVASVQNGVMRVQGWVERVENKPGDTVDADLISSLRATSDHTLTTLTQQNHSILKQLKGLHQTIGRINEQGQDSRLHSRHISAPDANSELIQLKEELRRKDISLVSLQGDLKELQDSLSNQRRRAEVHHNEAQEQRGNADRVLEQAKIHQSEMKERLEAAKMEAARYSKDITNLQKENLRLATELARMSASLDVEQQQRQWCEGQLQALQDARNAAEKRTIDLLSALPPSVHRTPPTGRDKQDEEAMIQQEAYKQEIQKVRAEKLQAETRLSEQQGKIEQLNLQLLKDEEGIIQQEVFKQEIAKVRAEKIRAESRLSEQQGKIEQLNLQLREVHAALALEQQEKAELEQQLKKSREILSKLQKDLTEAREKQEMTSNLEDLKRELEGEVLAKETAMEVLKGKIETLSKEKLQLKQDLLSLRGEKLSHDLLRQEKEFSEEMQRKTEEQLYDLQKKIPVEYVSRISVGLMQKELEHKYQRELTGKLSELQRSLDEQRKQHESHMRSRDARENQLREEVNRRAEEVLRLNARLSLGEEREDTWRVRHDRLLSLYNSPHHAITDGTQASHITESPVISKAPAEDSLAVTLKEINHHLKTPLATSTLLDQLAPPPTLHIGGGMRSSGSGMVMGGGSVDSYHHTHSQSIDRTINKYLGHSERLVGYEDKPQAVISPMQPSTQPGALPTIDQTRQQYVDLLKQRYGL